MHQATGNCGYTDAFGSRSGCECAHGQWLYPVDVLRPHLDAVKLLLAAGADPTVELQGGRTAAQIAQEMSCPECKALILEAAKNWTPPAKTPAR